MFSRGTWLVGAISGGLKQFKDTGAYKQGRISNNQYASQTTQNITEALGLMAGLEYGAMLGTALLPGIGTVIGTIVGATLGESLGDSVGGKIGSALFEPPKQQYLLMDG